MNETTLINRSTKDALLTASNLKELMYAQS